MTSNIYGLLRGMVKAGFAPGAIGSMDYGNYARAAGGNSGNNYYNNAAKASQIDPNLNGKNMEAVRTGAEIGSLAFGGLGAARAIGAGVNALRGAASLGGAVRTVAGTIGNTVGKLADGIGNAQAINSASAGDAAEQAAGNAVGRIPVVGGALKFGGDVAQLAGLAGNQTNAPQQNAAGNQPAPGSQPSPNV